MEKHNSDEELYDELKRVGQTIETSERHTLESPFIDSIVGTLDYYGVSQAHLQMTYTVLHQDKIKIYDYLGLGLRGNLNSVEDQVSNRNFQEAIRTLAKLYIKQKHVGGFGWWLRGHDLDIEEPSHCEDCIKSYDEWHNQSPQERRKEQEDLKKMYGGNVF